MKKILFALALFASLAVHAKEPAHIVFFYGGRSHGSGSHEFRAGSMLLAKCLNEQSAVKVRCTTIAGWPEDESILDTADAIVFYNDATRIVGNGWEKIDALAKKGTGLMFMHYAVHPNEKNGEKYFLPWMGAYFKNGQSVNPFWSARIKPLAGHPTSRGVEETETIDEYYHSLEFCTDCDVHKLGVAHFTKDNLVTINNLWTQSGYDGVGKKQTLLWGLDRPDGGRGAGFTGGHFHHNWAYDELRQLVLNTIVWVAGEEVPKDGVPVQPITEDELNANLDDYGPRTNRLALPQTVKIPFEQNKLLTPAERKSVRKNNSAWEKRRGQLINALTPLKK